MLYSSFCFTSLIQKLQTRLEKIHKLQEEKMDAKLKIFAVLMFFCLCNRGDSECSLSDLHVRQTTLQRQVLGRYQEYRVQVNNTCICSQTNVKLLCPGLNSSIRVHPAGVISPDADGKLCTLVNGDPVWSTDVIEFYYAWSTKFSFAPVSSGIACS